MAGNAYALSIQHVSHNPINIFNENDKGVNVRFNLDQAATVSLKIYDDREYLIRTIISDATLQVGDNVLHWDTRDASGKHVPSEAYHYTLVATNSEQSTTYDVTDLFTSNKNTMRDVIWDRKTGIVSYMLMQASRINIRAGISGGGPLLTTVINWLPRKRGQQIEKWHGYDSEKKFNIAKIPKAKIFTEAYSFPANTIIVDLENIEPGYIDEKKLTETRTPSTKKVKTLFDQASKIAQNRMDYGLIIDLPKTDKRKDGIPIYNENIPVKISVPKNDLQRMSRDRYEPILFLDGEYVSEIESGFLPLTWQLDVSGLTVGKHFITVNVRGYDGQYGATSKSIYIEK